MLIYKKLHCFTTFLKSQNIAPNLVNMYKFSTYTMGRKAAYALKGNNLTKANVKNLLTQMRN